MTSIWQVQDDVEGEASSVLLGALRDESRHLMVILVDGSARTRLHVNTICDDILHIPQENACYRIS